MKLAVLGESPADEAATRIICAEILGVQSLESWVPQLRTRVWPVVRDVLPNIIRHLHYQTDVDGLIVVADSDNSEPHELAHIATPSPDCRQCSLLHAATLTVDHLTPIPRRAALRTAVGVAISLCRNRGSNTTGA
jgi:hypothetical protein